MALALRDVLIKPVARRYVNLTLPASGYEVRIRSLTERERSAYESQLLNAKGDVLKSKLEEAKRRLICLCLVDDAGNRILSDSDADNLLEWDGSDTAAAYDVIFSHCGFQKRDIEDLVKNSVATNAG